MKRFRLLKYENNFWILQYYNEDEELIQEQFMNLDTARSFMVGLGFQLNFEPTLN
jgi:hypothetical protein